MARWNFRALMLTLAAGSVALSSPVRATELAPRGQWQVEATPESCRLWRPFSDGNQETVLSLYAYGPDGRLRVTLTGADIPSGESKAKYLHIGFGAQPQMAEVLGIASSNSGHGMMSFHLRTNRPSFAYFRTFDAQTNFAGEAMWPDDFSSLTIEGGDIARTTFALGDMSAALDQLQTCQFALAEQWGWARAQLDAIVQPPTPRDRDLVIARMNIPPAVALNRRSMIAQLRVDVDAEGQGSNCVIQSPSLEGRAQRDLCRPFLAERQFEPARDAQGNAVPGLFRMHYTYFIFN